MKLIIPRTLDNPPRWGGIPADIMVSSLGIWFIFMLADMPFWGLLVSPVVTWIYSKIKSRTLMRRAMRVAYWYLPDEVSLIPGVPCHIRKLKYREKHDCSKN